MTRHLRILRLCTVLLIGTAVLASAGLASADRIRDRCYSDSTCVFAGFVNTTIGEASLSIGPSGDAVYPRELRVQNNSSDFAGVRQYVDSFDMATRLVVPNFSLSQPGHQLIGLQRGVVDGVDGELFSTMTITNNGSGLTVEGDWSPINPTSYRIDIFLGEELVGFEENLATGTLEIEETIDIWIIDCRTPTHLTGTIHPEPTPTATFTIPGRGSYVGDNWAISAMGFEKIAWTQKEIDMLGNFPAFGILDEDTLPEPSKEDCNHNGIPDPGEVAAGLTPDADGDGRPDNCNGQ